LTQPHTTKKQTTEPDCRSKQFVRCVYYLCLQWCFPVTEVARITLAMK